MKFINFNDNSKKFFTISIVLLAVILVAAIVLGVDLDIQFKGGSIVTYAFEGELSTQDVESVVSDAVGATGTAQTSYDLSTQSDTVVITLAGSLTADEMVTLNEALIEKFPNNNLDTISINNVDPSMGSEFLAKCLTAVGLAFVLMIIYIWLRFRKIGGLSAGAMSVVALLHDVLIVFGVFILFRIPINDNFIAVVLTILGYSLNDTIVIYDRIRENKRLRGSKMSLSELVDLSINQSFKRSLATSITTISAMVVVAVVAIIYNISSIYSFALPMIIGLISGTYSSICIAGPLWVKWQNHKTAARS